MQILFHWQGGHMVLLLISVTVFAYDLAAAVKDCILK